MLRSFGRPRSYDLLEPIRRPEHELWAEFEQAWPRIFGALLEAKSWALCNIASVKLQRSPAHGRLREMGDRCRTQARQGAWRIFLKTNRESEPDDAAFEADAVLVAIGKLITSREAGWLLWHAHRALIRNQQLGPGDHTETKILAAKRSAALATALHVSCGPGLRRRVSAFRHAHDNDRSAVVVHRDEFWGLPGSPRQAGTAV